MYLIRAWDLRTNEWMHDFNKYGGLSLYGETIAFGYLFHDVSLPDWDKIIIEHSTGLKDHNGVDDYLGNIVQDVQTTCTCTVEYGAYKTRSGTGFGWFLQRLDGTPYIPYPYDLDVWEIIGNIHENKKFTRGGLNE